MKTVSKGMLFIFLVFAMLFATALLTWLGFHNGWDVIVDGETINGFPAICYAFGGTLFGIIAAVLALMFVVLVLTGVSLFVVILLAGIFVGVVILLSPLTIPLLLIVGLFMLLKRRKTPGAPAQPAAQLEA
jgi:hypothetical protein